MKQNSQKYISIIGGDLRHVYMSDMLFEADFSVLSYGLCQSSMPSHTVASSLLDVFHKSRIVISGIPFSKDGIHVFMENTFVPPLKISEFLSYLNSSHTLIGGNFPEFVTSFCSENNIAYLDLLHGDSQEVAIANTIPTAEGAIMEAIKNSSEILHQSPCLVLGFGRCAKILADKLKGLQGNVFICARKKEDLAYAKAYGYQAFPLSDLEAYIGDFTYIFNTVPSIILTAPILSKVNKSATIIDIASAPGGLDYEASKELGLNAHLCLGLPGKIAPKAAAKILTDSILLSPIVLNQF